VSISTDGAPAMIGKEKELVKRIRDKNTKILTYQCIIHQHLLVLSVTLKEVIDGLKSFYVNITRRIRWLSKGQVIIRF